MYVKEKDQAPQMANQGCANVQLEEALSRDSGGTHHETKRAAGVLYASNRYAILMIFQAMDAAGKDGVIKARHVWR